MTNANPCDKISKPHDWGINFVAVKTVCGFNLENIVKWRREESLRVTAQRRPDMLETAELDKKDKEFLRRLAEEE